MTFPQTRRGFRRFLRWRYWAMTLIYAGSFLGAAYLLSIEVTWRLLLFCFILGVTEKVLDWDEEQ